MASKKKGKRAAKKTAKKAADEMIEIRARAVHVIVGGPKDAIVDMRVFVGLIEPYVKAISAVLKRPVVIIKAWL